MADKKAELHRIFYVGTRGSALATAQTGQVVNALRKAHPKNRFEIVLIQTHGDEYQAVDLFKKNAVGVFTKEIEKRLLDRSIDIAVHSLKDLPTRLAGGLHLSAFPKREAVEDVLISRQRYTIQSLPCGARVGTGSLRRKQQLLLARPDLEVVPLRGNLDTRVKKVIEEKKLDAIVMAEAGLRRIGKFSGYARRLPLSVMMTAVSQGALGIQTRVGDRQAGQVTRCLNHAGTQIVCQAEREFLNAIQGGCRVPVGVCCAVRGGWLTMKARVFSVKTRHFLEQTVRVRREAWKSAARRLARDLRKRGAEAMLSEAREAEKS